MKNIAETLSHLEVNAISPILDTLKLLFNLLLLFNDNTSHYSQHANVQDGQMFDYIVVGGGTAGAVVANRLTENRDTSVLLIEAGGPPPLTSDVPGMFAIIDKSVSDWNYYAVDDGISRQALKAKTVHISAGKMLGGSSSLNYMSQARGCKADYDTWALQGNQGWDWKTVLKYFKKSERLDDIDILNECSALHSTNGSVTVRRALWTERTKKYFEAFKEQGHDMVLDLNGYKETGYSMAQFVTDGNKRQGSAVVFLRPLKHRKNLHLLLKTLVTRIVFNKNKRATGVEVILPDKNVITLKARKEVIVSAGAINSPKLLMLSGVGPDKHLKEMNIKLVHHSSNVGENLQDHVLVPVKLTGKQDISTVVQNIDFIANLDKFPNPVMTGRVALDETQECPDYQSYVLPLPAGSILSTILCAESFSIDKETCAAGTKAGLFRETLFAVVALLYPKSRGFVKLQSSNPKDHPIIRTGYFSDESDLERHAWYMENYVSVINTTYFRSVSSEIVDYEIKQCKHLRFASHAYWKCYVLNLASSMWDYSGTCAMGPDGKGVVDERLRVRGVRGLRVVDSSIMPTIVGGNINAAVTMIGEKASDMIKEDNGELWLETIAHPLSKLIVRAIEPLTRILQVVFSLLLLFNDNTSNYSPQAKVHDGQTFDYIIVGGGTAGSVVANRLTENSNTSVLLIEAGGPPPITSDIPGLLFVIDRTLYDWNYNSDNDKYSSQALRTKSLHLVSGKVLGGSSSVNYMSHVRGCKGDYDRWVELGNEGWDWRQALKYFKKSERLEDIDILKSCPFYHSTDGPVKIRRAVWKERTKKYFEAFKEDGNRVLLGLNGCKETGYSMSQFTTDDNIRQSSAVAYLRTIKDRINLHLLMYTLARKIVFNNNKRATGVVVTLPNKEVVTLRAKKEIIVCAGALNSPKLLMLSGVGPGGHLREMGIKVVHNLPNVGENLQDHPMVPIKITAKDDFSTIVQNLDFFANLDKFPTPVMIGRIAINKSQECPDYQTYVLPQPAGSILNAIFCTESFGIENDICTRATEVGLFKETVFINVGLINPESRGSVKLKSKNPEVAPKIMTGFYSNKKDLERHALYIQDVVKVVNTTYFMSVDSEIVDYKLKECKHLEFSSHAYWECFVLNLAATSWDYSGTCAMGPDGIGVVDERLRVRGVRGLRVVDSSIMPTIIGGNLNGAVTMIGEKGSDMIKEDNGEW